MYLEMYGFEEKPFHITQNPRFIFLSKIHKEAFAHLLYGIQQRVGFLSLSGEIGTGKTTVLRTLLGQLEDSEYRVALIFNPCLTALELLQTIHREFGIDYDSEATNLVELLESLNRFLLQQREEGKTVVLVVDEAQNLAPNVLEQLRLLSNLETETEKLIQMVLVGQPELDEILKRKDLRQLRQRLAVSYHLLPMDAEDTGRYIIHRVQIAGCQDSLFETQALEQVYRYTKGTPRLINILCDRALLVAFSRDAQTVSKQDVQRAQKELWRKAQSKTPYWGPISGVVSALFVFLAGFIFYTASQPVVDNDGAEQLQVRSAEAAANNTPLEVHAPAQIVSKDPKDIQELRRKIGMLSVEESGLQAVMALVDAWQLSPDIVLPEINGRYTLNAALKKVGFELIDLQGSLDDLLHQDAPFVLEITLPNVVGKRFLTIYRYRNGQFRCAPALNETGWLTAEELEAIWFGKAVLPYMDYQQLPLIDRPDSSGTHIAKVQRLIARLPGSDLSVSGVYDRQTIDFVTQFQRQSGLAPDGRIGSHTLFWLYRQAGYKTPQLKSESGK